MILMIFLYQINNFIIILISKYKKTKSSIFRFQKEQLIFIFNKEILKCKIILNNCLLLFTKLVLQKKLKVKPKKYLELKLLKKVKVRQRKRLKSQIRKAMIIWNLTKFQILIMNKRIYYLKKLIEKLTLIIILIREIVLEMKLTGNQISKNYKKYIIKKMIY